MNFNAALKHSFKALVYPATEHAHSPSPCLCSLVFCCDELSKQAAVLLVVYVSEGSQARPFVLQYDANSLLCGSVSLSIGSNISDQPEYNLLRDKTNRHVDFKTLAFSIEQPCPLWHSDAGPVGSRADVQSMRSLVKLAKATKIHIVFDYKNLRREHYGMFRAFSRKSRGLRGYGECLAEDGYKRARLEFINPLLTIAEAPPAYYNSPGQKRLESPISKSPNRSRHSTPGSWDTDKTDPLSPAAAEELEKTFGQKTSGIDFEAEAISAAIDRHLPACLGRFQDEAINAAIDKQFPGHLEKALRSKTSHAAMDKQAQRYLDQVLRSEAINDAVSKYLEKNLPTLLPQIIEPLLASSEPIPRPSSPANSVLSSATSVTIDESEINPGWDRKDFTGRPIPQPPPLTPLGALLVPHLKAHLDKQLQCYQAQQFRRFKKYVTETLEQLESEAYETRRYEWDQFEEDVHEHRTFLSTIKDEVVLELEHEADEALKNSMEQGHELVERYKEHLEEYMEEIYDKLTDGVNVASGFERLVAREVRKFKRKTKKRRVRVDRATRIGSGQSRAEVTAEGDP